MPVSLWKGTGFLFFMAAHLDSRAEDSWYLLSTCKRDSCRMLFSYINYLGMSAFKKGSWHRRTQYTLWLKFIFFWDLFIFILLCECFAFMCMSSTCGGQKRMSGLLELKFQVVVSYFLVFKLWSFERASKCLFRNWAIYTILVIHFLDTYQPVNNDLDRVIINFLSGKFIAQ